MMTLFMRHGQGSVAIKCERLDIVLSAVPRHPILLLLKQAIHDHRDGKEECHVD